MIVKKYETKEEWLEDRKRRITGSRLGKIVTLRGTGKKAGYYELIAERLSRPEDQTYLSDMERGHTLEREALDIFAKKTKKKLDCDLIMWQREDDDNIAISPDAVVIGEKSAVEVKCLNSATHIESFLTNDIPKEYEFQRLQYFIVNEKLETLYFVFYDPRIPAKNLFFFTFKRKDFEEDIKKYLEYQKNTLAEINSIVNDLTF